MRFQQIGSVEAAEFLIARDRVIGSPIDHHSLATFLPMSPIEREQISLYYTFYEQPYGYCRSHGLSAELIARTFRFSL